MKDVSLAQFTRIEFRHSHIHMGQYCPLIKNLYIYKTLIITNVKIFHSTKKNRGTSKVRPSPIFDSKIRVALLKVSLLIIYLSKVRPIWIGFFWNIPILDFDRFHITQQAVLNLFLYICRFSNVFHHFFETPACYNE